MFYIKERTENGEVKFDITDENVFTTCPGCGGEHQVDLAGVFDEDEKIDLFGTAVYCEACSKKMAGMPRRDRDNFDAKMDQLMEHFLDTTNRDGPNSPEAKAAGERLKTALKEGKRYG